jgi:thiol:disulfide interchange protein
MRKNYSEAPDSTFIMSFFSRLSTLFAIFLIAIGAHPIRAEAQISLQKAGTVVTTPQVTATALAYAPEGVEPGKPVWVGLQIQHQPEWHTYWKNSGDSGQPTEIQFTLPAGVQAGEVAWPAPKKLWIGTLANYGYENTVLLPVPLEVTSMFKPDVLTPALDVKFKAVWLVCKKECIPEEGEFALKIPVRGSTAADKAAFDAAFARSPQALKSAASVTLNKAATLAQQIEIAVPGLPANLQGKKLELFPETPEVIHNGAKLGDTVSNSDATASWTQRWDGAVWRASYPLSAQRSASPSVMPLVLSADGQNAVRVEAKVEGQWPAVAAAAQVPPELKAALEANAASQSKPVGLDGAAGNGVTSFLPALFFALIGGLILNLMPCVFPVLAIKVMGFTQAQDAKARVGGGLSYTVGVVLSFLALGGLLIALRAGGEAIGWGFQLQSPAFVAALAVLFTLIGLNLLGVYEFANVLPSSLATLRAKSPNTDSFLSGVLAVAVASPCTAPFMGASLGFALGLPAWQALAIFGALGVGMALPYLAASLVPAIARAMPRPGAWMDVFKRAMAFPMLATVVWLLWVLGQQSGINGVASLLALLTVMAMLVWALSLAGRSRVIVGALSAVSLIGLLWAVGPYVLQEDTAVTTRSSNNGWQAWQPGKVEQILTQGQPVFVDFTAAWCVTCQFNKQNALADGDVLADFQAKKVQLLRADWTRRDPAITAALQSLGRQGVPVYVLYKPGSAPVVLSEILSAAELRRALQAL